MAALRLEPATPLRRASLACEHERRMAGQTELICGENTPDAQTNASFRFYRHDNAELTEVSLSATFVARLNAFLILTRPVS
jgi:hypothetical protein